MMKVPICVYENGQKKVVGEAIVDVHRDSIIASGRITDPEYAKKMNNGFRSYSIGDLTRQEESTNGR